MEELPGSTLRIIDANLSRIGEGLRVLEEASRLVLNSGDLTAGNELWIRTGTNRPDSHYTR